MKANATKLLPFLHKASQFVVPIYQRNYSWDEKQCQQLWEDILRVGSNPDIDVTGKGRWGNGDVSINFKKIEDLPYVMGLIKQSLAKQLGANE